MKFDCLSEMGQEILGTVPPRIEMELVSDSFGSQLFVHLVCAGVETILVLIAAVDVDGLSSQLDLVFSSKVEGIVLFPTRNINWIAEHRTQQLSEWPSVLEVGVELGGRLGDQRRALRAH